MKLGGRKPSSGPSFTSHVSPFSWLSKFKQMRINSEPNPGKMKQKAKQNSPSVGSPQYTVVGMEVDYMEGMMMPSGDIHLVKTEESHEDKESKDIPKSVVCNLDDQNVIPSSSCRSGRRNAKKHGRREGTLKFKKKDIDLEEERKLMNDRKASLEMDDYNREKEFEYLRRRFERKAQSVLQEQLLKLEREAEEVEFASSKSVEKDVLQLESPRTICTPRIHSFASSADSKNFSLRGIIEDRVFNTQSFEKTDRPSQKKLSSDRKNLKQAEELKVQTNKQRQSLHVSRELQRRKPKHSPKVRVYSPRLASKVEICKIKALEDMRKAKLKTKKEKEEIVEETTGVDSFAVIKCSLDPTQDFRDSMIEMITEKQISQPEEMEELLACYLTLNVDEYHDLIIKVFRQLWFDMSQDGLGLGYLSDKKCCCYD